MSLFSKKIKFPFLFILLSSLFGVFSPLVVTWITVSLRIKHGLPFPKYQTDKLDHFPPPSPNWLVWC